MANTTIEPIVGQLSIPSDFGRDLLNNEIVIRDPVNEFEANLNGAITDDVFGVYNEIEAAEPGQAHKARFLRRGESLVRIQDSHSVTKYAFLTASASDPGSAVTAASTGHRFAQALEASPATVGQFIRCEIFADGPPSIVP